MLDLMTAQNSFKIYCGARLLLHREGSPRSFSVLYAEINIQGVLLFVFGQPKSARENKLDDGKKLGVRSECLEEG